MIWNQEDGTYRYYYFGDGWDNVDWDKKWYTDSDADVTDDDALAPGEAAWFYHQGSGCKMEIPAPIID